MYIPAPPRYVRKKKISRSRNWELFDMRYKRNLTFKKIGEHYGICRGGAHSVVTNILRTLKWHWPFKEGDCTYTDGHLEEIIKRPYVLELLKGYTRKNLYRDGDKLLKLFEDYRKRDKIK